MKITSNDCLAILRLFKLADDDIKPRHIEYLSSSNPSAINTLASFRFNKAQYHILFDDTVEDDIEKIKKQVAITAPNKLFTVIKNPQTQAETHGLPFKGKDCYLVKEQPQHKRLDIRLAQLYPEHSRSTWQKIIKKGDVTVNEQVQTSPKFNVTTTDSISIRSLEATDHSEQQIPTIFINDDVVVMNKPQGILTHSKGALNDEFTVADFARRYTTVGLESSRPGIVHRLDRDTSGVIIAARNDTAFNLLKEQFSERKAHKQYLAVVDGTPKQPVARIDVPIGRNPSKPSTFRVDSNGKSAITDYQVLTSNGNQSLLLLRPHTGRTHQLRVHMQHIGTPISGDRVYGKESKRMLLHAWKLEITIPMGDRRIFEAPVPTEFTTLFPDEL